MKLDDKPLGVKVVGYLSIIGGALGILAGLMLLLIGGAGFAGIAGAGAGTDAAQGAAVAGGLFGAFAAFAGIFAIIFGGIGIFVGLNILKLKNWARIVVTVLAALNLLNIPIGTIFGAIVIYFMWFDAETKAAFESAK
ncbi:hypothetical protein HUU53_01765 [Candidatus Micrarchaeota archaeon]|nr:hypothetical protein [Candidatus Micrarchaeota archaeon]